MKTWTGGDLVVARRLYQETFEFAPQCKLVVAANHRPHARDDDDALWRRIVEIPFAKSLPAAERDPDVKAVLMDPHRPARRSRLGRPGAADWFANGLGSAPEIDAATARYRAEMDPLADFFKDACVLDPDGELPASMLRQEYEIWCRDSGVRFPLSARKLAARLEAGVPAAPGACGDSILGGHSASHAG